jgi:hypothetical protein
MDSGKRVSITFKASRLTRLIEGPALQPAGSMTKKTGQHSAESAGKAAAAVAAASVEVSAEEEGMAGGIAEVNVGSNSPPFTTVTNKKKSADIRSFLQAAAGGGGVLAGGRTPTKRGRVEGTTPPKEKPEAKRMTTQGASDEEDAFEDAQGEMENKMEEMKRKLLERAGLSPQQAQKVMEVLREDLQDIIRVATKEIVASAAKEAARSATTTVREEVNKQLEADRCRRSVLIHNADRWVKHFDNGYGLAENITAQIHRCMGYTVLVLDAFTVGQWVGNRPPTSVFVTFRSVAQKAQFFKVLARVIAENREGADIMRGISCRDAFPRELVEEARSLAQKGFDLRKNGKVAAFRVVARGPACIPVLEVRARLANNARGRWEVYRPRDGERAAPHQVGEEEASEQEMETGDGGAAIRSRRATPRKSLANEDIVPCGMSDEELCSDI